MYTCVDITHGVLECVTVYCSVLQCVAVCCSVLQCGESGYGSWTHTDVLMFISYIHT